MRYEVDGVSALDVRIVESLCKSSFCNAASLVSSIPANGVAGAGFCRALISSRAAARTASIDAVFGMGTCAGNHSRVSVILSAPVSITYTL